MNGVHFEKAGEVHALGDGQQQYRFTDVYAPVGNVYYRIKQSDNDGSFSYSEVVKLHVGQDGAIYVWPVPARDRITISSPAIQSALLLNETGKTILSVKLKAGNNFLYVGALSPGIYFLRTEDGSVIKLNIIP